MTLLEELARISSIFIDTAPIIYYIEAHPDSGPIYPYFQTDRKAEAACK